MAKLRCRTFLQISLLLILLGTATTNCHAEDPLSEAARSTPMPAELPAVTPELLKIPVAELEQSLAGQRLSEALTMYLTIAKEAPLGAQSGWFGPAASRYGWKWLAEQQEHDPQQPLPRDKFRGPAWAFGRLDRNRDGRIAAEDLDWSDQHPWVQQAGMITRLLRKLDRDGSGRLSREEWNQLFDQAANAQPTVTIESLRETWLAGLTSGFLPGDAPSNTQLLDSLFRGELGSLQEGPALESVAPDFSLTTQDGSRTIRLSEQIGKKPVVLVFGNFTCGPFRALYPGIDELAQRYQDSATFLVVYVREAHPSDGWRMESNTQVGVELAQPKTYGDRVAVAQQCHRTLKGTLPMLVDDIDDTVGNLYSGMPTRFYIIDNQGRIAFKSGRGPFGFKPGEMEQALVMSLLSP